MSSRREGNPVLSACCSPTGIEVCTTGNTQKLSAPRSDPFESPYRSLKVAVWHSIENTLPPLLDQIAYVGLLVVSPLVLPDLAKTSPVEAISGIPADVPVLILAGG
jgi:hypothetical protein